MVDRRNDTIFGDNWDDLEIEIPNGKIYSASDIKIRRCPECERVGKKHINDSSLSVIPIQGIGKCHKCGTKFIVRQPKEKVEFNPPSKANLTVLQSDGLKFLTDRKISQEAIKRLKLTQQKSSVAFSYFFNEELVNIKYRFTTKKGFFQSPGGMHIVYNYDNVKEYMESSGDFRVIIVEGELDTGAYETENIHFATSLDSGAIGPKDKDVDGKLECITNAHYIFDMAEIIYIGVDNDESGRRTVEELIRRFPVDKIRIIDYGIYKDANECLMFGVPLQSLLDNAKEIQQEGIFYANDVRAKLKDNYRNGYNKGTTTYLPSVDKVWSWRFQEVSLLTGYANEGKTNLAHFLVMLKATFETAKSGIFSPENFPSEEFFEDLIHMATGKSSDKEYLGRISEEAFDTGIDFVDRHFFLIYPEKNATLQEIFDRIDYLIRRKGIKYVIIDPYNQLEHHYEKGEREDLYISRFMSMLKRFAVTRNVAVLLLLHQNKPEEETADGNWPAPSMYRMKGGGTFADKADNVLSLHRPYRLSFPEDPTVIFESHKIKKKKLTGTPGKAILYYDWKKNQYLDPELNGMSPMDAGLSVPATKIESKKVEPVQKKLELFE